MLSSGNTSRFRIASCADIKPIMAVTSVVANMTLHFTNPLGYKTFLCADWAHSNVLSIFQRIVSCELLFRKLTHEAVGIFLEEALHNLPSKYIAFSNLVVNFYFLVSYASDNKFPVCIQSIIKYRIQDMFCAPFFNALYHEYIILLYILADLYLCCMALIERCIYM